MWPPYRSVWVVAVDVLRWVRVLETGSSWVEEGRGIWGIGAFAWTGSLAFFVAFAFTGAGPGFGSSRRCKPEDRRRAENGQMGTQ